MFSLSQKVNSQLFSHPVWQSDGTTGEIVEEIDISALTNTDTQITLFASSTNIGDSALPTTVTAELSFKPELSIKSVKPLKPGETTIHNENNPYSIPQDGEGNTFHRYFEMEITCPEDYAINTIEAYLKQGETKLMMVTQVIDYDGSGVADGIKVKKVGENKFQVRVTTESSKVNSVPPPAHNIIYQFIVYAGKKGQAPQTELSAKKDSASYQALWRMPYGFERFGTRDDGHDDWCSKETYSWLKAKSGLVTAINDISGEHGRNIGHASHKFGTDIDMYHFVNFLNTGRNGTLNYIALRDNVIDALNGNANAKDRVSDWASSTRQGIDALAKLDTVSTIISALGGGTTVLPNGWARTLLEQGTLTATVGGKAITLNLNLAEWNNGKSLYRNDHNDHIHITLNPNNLNN